MESIAVCITGSTSFIGRHLIDNLLSGRMYQVRCLSRSPEGISFAGNGCASIFQGDLLVKKTLQEFLTPECTVVNLAFDPNATYRQNLQAARNLGFACAEMKIARLIHCSTAMVAGAVRDRIVDETTPCRPVSTYERSKFGIEGVLRASAKGKFDLVILRPTAVFGLGGRNLVKLLKALHRGSSAGNYLRSSLFNRRAMNLVAVETVVECIRFFVELDQEVNGEAFIVSQDEDPLNNFECVERIMMSAIGRLPYAIPKLPMPAFALGVALRFAGKSYIDPHRLFISRRLGEIGFLKRISLEDAIIRFVGKTIKAVD